MNQKKNIILITIDCLRADHIHCMGYKKDITQNMDSLAQNGILFTNAVANGPHTPYSIPSLFTSILPPITEKTVITIPRILKKHGYKTAAFNPNPIIITSRSTPGCGLEKDFDNYEMLLSSKIQYRLRLDFLRMFIMKKFRYTFDENRWIHKNLYSLYKKAIKLLPAVFYPKYLLQIPNAININEKAIHWIKNQKSKFFAWIHYMDVHEPYAPLQYKKQSEMWYLITKYRDFPNKLTDQEIQKLVTFYDMKIEFTDSALGMFLNELKKINCYNNCIIIISADHGDAFGEHETLGHGGKFRDQLYDEVIHVPLIIHGQKKGIIIDRPVQLLDLAPTICELLHIPKSPSFNGVSLLDHRKKGVISNASSAISYRTEQFKLIINKENCFGNELYDIKKDPDEKKNIYRTNNEVVKKLESELITELYKYKKKKEMLDIDFNLKIRNLK